MDGLLITGLIIASRLWIIIYIAAPVICIYLAIRKIQKRRKAKSKITEINHDLDRIENELDERLTVDNSNGKIIRIETLKEP